MVVLSTETGLSRTSGAPAASRSGPAPPSCRRPPDLRLAVQTITVVDDAHMLSKKTVRDLVTRIARITDQCRENVWVITVPAFSGRTVGEILEKYTGTRPVGITIVLGRHEKKAALAANSNKWGIVDLAKVKSAIDAGLKQGDPDRAILQGMALLEASL